MSVRNRDKPVISFTLDEEIIKRIEAFQRKNNIASRSRAVNELLTIALDEIELLGEAEDEIEFDPITEIDFLTDLLTKLKDKIEANVDKNASMLNVSVGDGKTDYIQRKVKAKRLK